MIDITLIDATLGAGRNFTLRIVGLDCAQLRPLTQQLLGGVAAGGIENQKLLCFHAHDCGR